MLVELADDLLQVVPAGLHRGLPVVRPAEPAQEGVGAEDEVAGYVQQVPRRVRQRRVSVVEDALDVSADLGYITMSQA